MSDENEAWRIVEAALGLRTSEEQIAYLDEACAGDAELRARIEALLQNQPPKSDGLGAPPPIKTEPSAAGSPAMDASAARTRKRRATAIILAAVDLVILAALGWLLFRAALVRNGRLATSGPDQTQPVNDSAPAADTVAQPMDAADNTAVHAPTEDCLKRLDARACLYDFSAKVTTTSGQVYDLSKVQTVSRFPFPQAVKERFGRLMVMAWAPTTDAAESAPARFQHFWFSRVKRLRNAGTGLEVLTIAGKTFRSDQGWLSKYRHKRYPYENRDTHHDILVGLVKDTQVCLDTLDIAEMVFTTSDEETQRFERDLQTVLPPRQPALFRFGKRAIPADRFFLIDAAGSWMKTDFFYQWWPGGLDLTIWHDTGQGSTNFWELPQREISRSELKSIQFGPAPDWIRVQAQLRNGSELKGYFVTYTESQRGVWQWNAGREGFWDSVALFTEEGLNVYAMFPGGPRFAEFAQEVGPLASIAFEDELPLARPQ